VPADGAAQLLPYSSVSLRVKAQQQGYFGGFDMTQAIQTLRDGYQGLMLLFEISVDRLLMPTAIGFSLSFCAYLMTL
jgi:hypothetical protein